MSGFLHTWGWSLIAAAIWLPGGWLIYVLFSGKLFTHRCSDCERCTKSTSRTCDRPEHLNCPMCDHCNEFHDAFAAR